MKTQYIALGGTIIAISTALSLWPWSPKQEHPDSPRTEEAIAAPPPPLEMRGNPVDFVPMWLHTLPGGTEAVTSLFVSTLKNRLTVNYACDTVPGLEDKWCTQEIPTPYWPTTATFLTENRIIVGGRMRSGETCIEIIEYEPPRIMWDIQTHEGSIVPRPIKQRSYSYLESNPDRDLVTFFQAMLPDSSSVLLGFHSSGDIYSMDLETGDLEIQASPLATTTLHVPELEPRFRESWVGTHEDLGLVYYVGTGTTSGVTTGVALIDSDMDQSMDSYVRFGSQDWTDFGMGDATKYSDWGE